MQHAHWRFAMQNYLLLVERGRETGRFIPHQAKRGVMYGLIPPSVSIICYLHLLKHTWWNYPQTVLSRVHYISSTDSTKMTAMPAA